jgi:hypothetical protein
MHKRNFFAIHVCLIVTRELVHWIEDKTGEKHRHTWFIVTSVCLYYFLGISPTIATSTGKKYCLFRSLFRLLILFAELIRKLPYIRSKKEEAKENRRCVEICVLLFLVEILEN